jgi:AAA15 family ATPase/GTPase
MLLNFNTNNCLSFKDGFEFSMEAAKLKNLKTSNVFSHQNQAILSTAVIYGANASGKSNFIKSFSFMKWLVLSSMHIDSMKNYQHSSFALNTLNQKKPTKFEIEIILDKVKYLYGFIIDKKADIIEEWLHKKNLIAHAREVSVFKRKKEEYVIKDIDL